ncbi:hypothetical protein AAG570_011139 [Ranatra chinensis]|uniref:Uncharacterized protein n=1 Tax=Ranatra chinensis TaxID=642074 RepID=A0ABD0YJW2_9HEMI
MSAWKLLLIFGLVAAVAANAKNNEDEDSVPYSLEEDKQPETRIPPRFKSAQKSKEKGKPQKAVKNLEEKEKPGEEEKPACDLCPLNGPINCHFHLPQGCSLLTLFGCPSSGLKKCGNLESFCRSCCSQLPNGNDCGEGSDDESDEGGDGESNDGSTDESNDGSTDESNDGSTDESNDGNTDESNDGSTDESNDGSSDESNGGSNDGSADESNDGSTDESNGGSNDGSADESNDGSTDESNDGSNVGIGDKGSDKSSDGSEAESNAGNDAESKAANEAKNNARNNARSNAKSNEGEKGVEPQNKDSKSKHPAAAKPFKVATRQTRRRKHLRKFK